MPIACCLPHPQLQALVFHLEYKLRGRLGFTLAHPIETIQKLVSRETQPLFHRCFHIQPAIQHQLLEQRPDWLAQNYGAELPEVGGL